MQPPPPHRPSFLQFRLRSLFILTFAVAVLSWLITILPPEFWFILGFPTLPIVGLSASILGVIYLSGWQRAFWLGFGIALLQVMVLGFFVDAFDGRVFRDWEALFLIPFFVVVVPVLTGFVGVYFFWLGQANKPATTPPTPPSEPTHG